MKIRALLPRRSLVRGSTAMPRPGTRSGGPRHNLREHGLAGAALAAVVIAVPTGIIRTPFYHRMMPVKWWDYRTRQ